MSSSRNDAQRLFRHFGLDPSQYVDLSQQRNSVTTVSGAQTAASNGSDRRGRESTDADLFDYRNFELGR